MKSLIKSMVKEYFEAPFCAEEIAEPLFELICASGNSECREIVFDMIALSEEKLNAENSFFNPLCFVSISEMQSRIVENFEHHYLSLIDQCVSEIEFDNRLEAEM